MTFTGWLTIFAFAVILTMTLIEKHGARAGA